jgi:hypothetical protein
MALFVFGCIGGNAASSISGTNKAPRPLITEYTGKDIALSSARKPFDLGCRKPWIGASSPMMGERSLIAPNHCLASWSVPIYSGFLILQWRMATISNESASSLA